MQADQGPVVLSWDSGNEEQVVDEGSMSNSANADASDRAGSLNVQLIPMEDPPSYAAAAKPTRTVAYSFSPNSFNSMVLLPPPDAQDTRPRYFISVHTNCFNPSSWITNVYRGSNEYGEHVGDFEIGTSAENDTVCIKGKEFPIDRKFRKESEFNATRWAWILQEQTPTRPRKAISWTYSKNNKKQPHLCTGTPVQQKLTTTLPVLARFTPKNELRKPNEAAPLARLEVTPDGHECFDDIVMSLLIKERIRLASR